MALRHRDIVAAVADQNHDKPAKAVLSKQPSLKSRPALHDVQNTVSNPTTKDSPKATKPVKNHAKNEQPAPKSRSCQQLEIMDPDADCKDEPQMVTEYLADIYNYLRELEVKFPVNEKFMEGHESSPRMRAILVNWLVQVHSNFKLCLETLYVCVSIIDRYIQENKLIGRENLQLVGTAALLVACKYEEMYLPELRDFTYICDNAFSEKQVLRMEKDILRVLDFNLGKPVAIHFIRRYSKIAQVRLDQHTLAKYILELALLDHNFSSIRPSMQAAAACCLSLCIFNNVICPSKVWTPTLVHYTSYKYSDFKHVVSSFANMLLGAESSKNQSIYSKYAAATYSKISVNPKLKGYIIKKLAVPVKS